MEILAPEHIAAMALTAVLCAVAIVVVRTRSGRWGAAASRAFAAGIATTYLVEQAAYALRGDWSVTLNLPFHLTDFVTLTAVAALVTGHRLPVELTYFWALTASLLAVLTPEIAHGFPDVYFFTYFATHSGAVVAAVLLVFGRRLVPRPGAVRRAFLATAHVACCATVANLLTGGNYMYLRAKPHTASLLDLLGPWPIYVLAAAALALALFSALYAPFRRPNAPAA